MKRVIEVEKKLLDKLCSTENFFQSLAKHNIIILLVAFPGTMFLRVFQGRNLIWLLGFKFYIF